jgi:glycosyltransferase involved in cell wall biosynthesis
LKQVQKNEYPSKAEVRVSIGLPVYNGENFLKCAIESILTQTYTDFELIISDNASEDGTQDICQRFAEKDHRVHYYRNSTNLGLFKNFNQVFQLSKGKYFQWMAHDDLLAPEFLSKTVPILDQNDSIVICHTQEIRIDVEGKTMALFDYPSRASSEIPRERFHDALFVPPVSVSGLIRSDALRKTRLHLEFIGSDWNLAFELAMLGRFYEVPERLYLRRSHPQESIKLFPKHERMAYSCPSKAKQVSFPTWRQSYEYFRSVQRFNFPLKDKADCYSELFGWVLSPRTKIDLKKDIRMATKKLLLRSKYGERIYQILRHQNGKSMLAVGLGLLSGLDHFPIYLFH